MPFDFTPKGLLKVRHLYYARFWFLLGVLLVLGVIYASVADVPELVKSVNISDKIIHVVVYAGLMGWFTQIFRHDLTRLAFVFLLVFMGVTMEFIQAATPTRQFEVLDMIANTCGVILAWALAYTWVGNILWWFESLFVASPEAVS